MEMQYFALSHTEPTTQLAPGGLPNLFYAAVPRHSLMINSIHPKRNNLLFS